MKIDRLDRMFFMFCLVVILWTAVDAYQRFSQDQYDKGIINVLLIVCLLQQILLGVSIKFSEYTGKLRTDLGDNLKKQIQLKNEIIEIQTRQLNEISSVCQNAIMQHKKKMETLDGKN